MPHELFEEITVPRRRAATRSPYTIAVSIAAHAAIISAVVIAPLIAVDVLPNPMNPDDLFVPVVHVPPAPPPPPRITSTTRDDAEVRPTRDVPLDAPDGVHDETPPADPSGALTIGDPMPSNNGVDGSLGGKVESPQAPPKPAPTPVINTPLPVGGQIREPQKIFSVAPVYPSIARAARIQGDVLIQAVIGVDGAVREARAQSGHPLLDQAALDAVRQWRYRPTLLNGVPVPVVMTVSVRFTLQ
jgi:periplasmic protein TonB